MAISTYLANKFLDTLGNSSFAVTTVYVKLHTGDPGSAGTNNAATEATRKSLSWASAASGSKATNASITWTNVAATETYSHASLWDASSNGNYLWSVALTSSASVTAGDTYTMASGNITTAIA